MVKTTDGLGPGASAERDAETTQEMLASMDASLPGPGNSVWVEMTLVVHGAPKQGEP